jgi:hypothetical protein
MKLKDLPNFPPTWQTATFSEKSGLIGTLRYIKPDWEKKRLFIGVSDAGELLIGNYQTDIETLKDLVLLLQKGIGKPLALIAESELAMVVLVLLF